MRDLTGKVVAIMGAGSGLGRALAINFAQHGTSVALADVDQHRLLDTASMISSNDRAASTHRIMLAIRLRSSSLLLRWSSYTAALTFGDDELL